MYMHRGIRHGINRYYRVTIFPFYFILHIHPVTERLQFTLLAIVISILLYFISFYFVTCIQFHFTFPLGNEGQTLSHHAASRINHPIIVMVINDKRERHVPIYNKNNFRLYKKEEEKKKKVTGD